MPEPLPLDGSALIAEWWESDVWASSQNLYRPQGYTGFESIDGVTEMYAQMVVDHDLEIYYCFSVRWRPYLAMATAQGAYDYDANPEVRDYLFVSRQLLKMYPEQAAPDFRHAWMGRPCDPFDPNHPTMREVWAAFADFIDPPQEH